MFELCLMASHGYPSALVLHHQQHPSREIKDCQPLLSICGARPEIAVGSVLRSIHPEQSDELWKSIIRMPESNQLVEFDPRVRSLRMVDAQDNQGDSLIFGSRSDEEFKKYEKFLEFLVSCPSEDNKRALNLPDLMGLQELNTQWCRGPLSTSHIFPSCEFDAHEPIMDFIGELIRSSKITVLPDGQIFSTETGTKIKDLLSVVAEFYLSKNSLSWSKQSILVPNYDRLNGAVGSHIYDSSLKLHATTISPIKSPDIIKVKPSRKNRNSKKVGRERDLYKKNYFHACESMLSYMFNKQRHGRKAIQSLKNSGRELPQLLTQFSASIAGTGLVVLFSVMSEVAYGRAPMCSSNLLNTGFGLGLLWLSFAVNKLRDTIICISKKANRVGLKEDEMTRRVDKSLNEIFFRAATLMTVAILRIG
ncbi:hypothetical protein IC582_010051 [Cucumis melo]|uniref:Uncharacterized protein n=2 Tax=Cucumis melo TaxID=3656 RepID=A0A5A7URL6_CUCMM|nr:uncharacterized protein E6C27_scaffold280G001280 [Cucumis melo var. makuwa]TYK13445.1 uncharacterized protein E5676_scaffold496G00670 [Cucumis melo var. makuwa]